MEVEKLLHHLHQKIDLIYSFKVMYIKLIKISYTLPMVVFLLLSLESKSSENISDSEAFISLISMSDNISANYDLKIYDENSELKESSSGIFGLLRPSFIKITTKKPYDQTLILDENKFTQYDPDIEQLIIKNKSRQMTYLSNLLLMDDPSIFDEKFTVKKLNLNIEKDRYLSFEILLKSNQSPFKKIHVSFLDKKLSALKIFDTFDTVMVFRLHDNNLDTILTKKDFEIMIPDHTEVIYQ